MDMMDFHHFSSFSPGFFHVLQESEVLQAVHGSNPHQARPQMTVISRWLDLTGDVTMSENCNDIPLMIFNRHQKWHRNVMTVMTHVSVRVFLTHDRESHVGNGVSLDAEARGTNDKQNKKPTAATHCTSNLDGRQWRQTGYLRLGCQLLLACDLMC